MKPRLSFLLALGLAGLVGCASHEKAPTVLSLGNDTYSITRIARTGFVRNTDRLKSQALEQASAFCADRHKQMKVVSATGDRPGLILTGYAKATVVFKALDSDSPELREPAPAAQAGGPSPASVASDAPPEHLTTNALYDDLMKLDDLRKRGILTEQEFQSEKQKLLNRSN